MSNISVNVTGCDPQRISPVIPIFLSLVFFVGFLLNCISLWIFWSRISPWNCTTILQFNLAISDAIITPAAPLIIIYSLTDHWAFGTFLCQLKVFLLSTHMYGSISFLTLISLHRYFTVAHKVKTSVLTRKSFITKLCLIVWGCLCFQGFPFFITMKTSEIHNATKCLSVHQTELAALFFVWNWVIFSGLLFPLTITIICYSRLSRFILQVNPMNPASKAMISKSIRTISISMVIFIVCYVPVHVTRTLAVTIALFCPTFCSLLESLEVAYYITWMLSGTNCCLDPVLYCFASDRFKSKFTSWFTFLQARRHVTRSANVTAQHAQEQSDTHTASHPAVSTIYTDGSQESGSNNTL
ncbi:P2Y purinoceptor 4-like [Pelodytes ibericus]